MSDHECKVVKLKDRPWGQSTTRDDECIMVGQHLSCFQIRTASGGYAEGVNPGFRGGIASSDKELQPGVFDVAVAPPSTSTGIKHGMIALLAEKISNDIETYNRMIVELENQGDISLEDGESMKMDREDVGMNLLHPVGPRRVSYNAVDPIGLVGRTLRRPIERTTSTVALAIRRTMGSRT
jgi:hypothetical protein